MIVGLSVIIPLVIICIIVSAVYHKRKGKSIWQETITGMIQARKMSNIWMANEFADGEFNPVPCNGEQLISQLAHKVRPPIS